MIGIDIVQISRIKTAKERFGSKFIERFLSQKEASLVHSDASLAGFWATKEACAKALGCGIGKELGFLDLIISKTINGKPIVHLSKQAQNIHNVQAMHVSISHDGDYAICVAKVG